MCDGFVLLSNDVCCIIGVMGKGSFMPVWRGIAAGVAIVFIAAALITLDVALGYDGNCGGFIPFTGEPSDCTFTEYMALNLHFTFGVIIRTYWYVIVTIFVLPTVVSLLLHRPRAVQ